jgi:hypothetical protein
MLLCLPSAASCTAAAVGSRLLQVLPQVCGMQPFVVLLVPPAVLDGDLNSINILHMCVKAYVGY